MHGKKIVHSITLLLAVMLTFSSFITVFSKVSPLVSATPDKIVSNESELVAVLNGAVKPTIIALKNDITIKNCVIINNDKNITLTTVDGKARKITCVKGEFRGDIIAISVAGELTLDGIIVTHAKDVKGIGVIVSNNGIFTMVNGEISGNNADSNSYERNFGGGVYIYDGIFEMYGGKISNNGADKGGGVYNYGTFKMFGGEISGNKANTGGGVYNDGGIVSLSGGMIIDNTATDNGGGVYNDGSFSASGGAIINNMANNGGGVYNRGTFSLSAGSISNNTAVEQGGGVYNYVNTFSLSGGTISGNTANLGGGVAHNGKTFTMVNGIISGNTAVSGGGVYIDDKGVFLLNGGMISNNRALGNGGGVWISDYAANFTRLFVSKGVMFSNNYASEAYNRNRVHEPTYNMQIKGDVWSEPFTQGYNNYDISYVYGTPLTFYNVTIQNSYAKLTGAGNYVAGATITINAGIREGYTFSSWTTNNRGITLTNNTATTTFTMPERDIVLTANWTPTQPLWITIIIVICTVAIIIAIVSVLLKKRTKKIETNH
ncbi:MAG: hypothetical protein FWH37_00930 [Candidatus Bathyarchaeota archaeon]|nr:hypothetical protein [Candidatus Termiticorpusculum sp.]